MRTKESSEKEAVGCREEIPALSSLLFLASPCRLCQYKTMDAIAEYAK